MPDTSEQALLSQLEAADEQTAEYAALLNDLGLLKLEQGATAEAQQLFNKALEARAASDPQSEPADTSTQAEQEELEDWETDWAEGLEQVVPATASQPAKADANQRAGHQPPPPPQRKQQQQPTLPAARSARQSTPSRGSPSGAEHAEASEEMPFHGQHILELHGVSAAKDTLALEAFLQQFGLPPQGPVLRWVDDKHALAVFPNPAGAREALARCAESEKYGQKIRSFAEASDASRSQPIGQLLPPKPRPRTSDVVARRLIGNALSMTGVRNKAGEKDLAAERQAAAETRKVRREQVDAAWSD